MMMTMTRTIIHCKVRPGVLGGLLGVRPGDRLLRYKVIETAVYNNSDSMDGFFRVQDESLDSVPDAWRLLCHTYGR